MALDGIYSNLEIFLRWLHVIAGITWIGILYFFNWINSVLQGQMDDATKKTVNPQLMPRALWWFRWGAMVTFLAGLGLFTMIYMYTPGVGFGPSITFVDESGISERAIIILMGMLFGTIMWFNVWFVIWPAQKALLGGTAGDQAGALRARAGLFSKINTYLSGPMLFGMLGANHYGAVNAMTMVVFIVIGLAAIKVAYAHAGKVGKSV